MALSYHQQEEMHEKVTKGKYEIMWVPQKENVRKEDKKTLLSNSLHIKVTKLKVKKITCFDTNQTLDPLNLYDYNTDEMLH